MTSAADPKPMSRTTAILYAIGLPLAPLALVFLPAGRIDWAPGWIFIAVPVAAFGLSALLLARVNPMIYRARNRFQPGTEKMGPDPARGHARGHGPRPMIHAPIFARTRAANSSSTPVVPPSLPCTC